MIDENDPNVVKVPANTERMEQTMDDIAALPADVSDMKLDLTKDEKLRTAALMLGIRYYTETIIKDPQYLQLMMQREKEMQFSNDPEKENWHLRPATVHSVIHCAQEFEQFLLGNRSAFASLTIGDEEIKPNRADIERAQGEIKTGE